MDGSYLPKTFVGDKRSADDSSKARKPKRKRRRRPKVKSIEKGLDKIEIISKEGAEGDTVDHCEVNQKDSDSTGT